MKQCSQTHKETAIQNQNYLSQDWHKDEKNVRTLYKTGNSKVARKMDKNGVEVLGLIEV